MSVLNRLAPPPAAGDARRRPSPEGRRPPPNTPQSRPPPAPPPSTQAAAAPAAPPPASDGVAAAGGDEQPMAKLRALVVDSDAGQVGRARSCVAVHVGTRTHALAHTRARVHTQTHVVRWSLTRIRPGRPSLATLAHTHIHTHKHARAQRHECSLSNTRARTHTHTQRIALRAMLLRLGHTCEALAAASAFLDRAAAAFPAAAAAAPPPPPDFDVVLMAAGMAGVTGWDAAAELRRRERALPAARPPLPLVAVVAGDAAEDPRCAARPGRPRRSESV
jgi:CheY-like chemotaxis protein